MFKKISLILVIVGPLLVTSLKAQEFDPFSGKPELFHVRLDRYFQTRAQELTDRKALLSKVIDFNNDKHWQPAVLKTRLETYEKLIVALQRHSAYTRILKLSNTQDTAAAHAETLVNNAVDQLESSVEHALQAPALRRLTSFQLNRLHLTGYRYMLAKAQRTSPKPFSAERAAIINQLSDPILNGLVDRYDNLINKITAPPISKSAADYYGAYSAHKDLAAATLIDITRAQTGQARVDGFSSAITAKYRHHLEMGEDSVKLLLQELQSQAGVLQDYQLLEAAIVKKRTGQADVHSWELSLPPAGVPEKLTFDQAKPIILQSLAPLGTDYVQHFTWLLNPANGALEISGGLNRAGGGTSISYPGVPTSFYMKRFGGDLQSMLTMIHEGGHAIHKKLMGESLAVPTYSSGPHFLFEAFAVFNELLLFDTLIDSAKTPLAKSYYTQRLTDFLAHEIFTSAEEGSFEQDLYEGVAHGSIIQENDIDSLYGITMNRYDIFFNREPERKSEWIKRRLFFEDPLYNINYLYAILVACKLYNMEHQQPQEFKIRYNRLLRNGFDDTADNLLKKYMGFGLGHQSLLNGAIGIMKLRVDSLKEWTKEK